MMLERKKSEMRKKRKRKDIDLINDNDDAIAKMIADMKLAAREDRELNQKRLPATKKISMLKVRKSTKNIFGNIFFGDNTFRDFESRLLIISSLLIARWS